MWPKSLARLARKSEKVRNFKGIANELFEEAPCKRLLAEMHQEKTSRKFLAGI